VVSIKDAKFIPLIKTCIDINQKCANQGMIFLLKNLRDNMLKSSSILKNNTQT